MVFAPPSSVGDIIAIITLIAQVISTIANSGEQLKEYGSLILELKELMRVFEKVEEIGKLSLSSEALAIYLAIMEHVIQSKMTIKVFQRKKYLPKKWYRKLIWSFLAGSRADSLQRKLFTQRVAVDTYLSLYVCLISEDLAYLRPLQIHSSASWGQLCRHSENYCIVACRDYGHKAKARYYPQSPAHIRANPPV